MHSSAPSAQTFHCSGTDDIQRYSTVSLIKARKREPKLIHGVLNSESLSGLNSERGRDGSAKSEFSVNTADSDSKENQDVSNAPCASFLRDSCGAKSSQVELERCNLTSMNRHRKTVGVHYAQSRNSRNGSTSCGDGGKLGKVHASDRKTAFQNDILSHRSELDDNVPDALEPAGEERPALNRYESDPKRCDPLNGPVSCNTRREGLGIAAESGSGSQEATLCAVGHDTGSKNTSHRPKICSDVGDFAKDLLILSNIPQEMTFDKLRDIVEPFGDISALNWDASDPSRAEVLYEDSRCAKEAAHYLNNSLICRDGLSLQAELRSRNPSTQLFVGDLTPDVTETMLEDAFQRLVLTPVKAILKRDPINLSPVGYGFLSFRNEHDAGKALVQGHRMKVGNASIRVGRAERNTFLYVADIDPKTDLPELLAKFGQYGDIIEEDTIIVRRAYAFVRYKDRVSAERAKRSLDRTDMRGRITVRYAEAEPIRTVVEVQFHSSTCRPPCSLRELMQSLFSKYGACSVEIPRWRNGFWRRVAFVHFHGNPLSAAAAAVEAVQNVKFVSTFPVLCQFARELIPRVSPSRAAVESLRERRYGASAVETSSMLSRMTACYPQYEQLPGMECRGIEGTGSDAKYADIAEQASGDNASRLENIAISADCPVPIQHGAITAGESANLRHVASPDVAYMPVLMPVPSGIYPYGMTEMHGEMGEHGVMTVRSPCVTHPYGRHPPECMFNSGSCGSWVPQPYFARLTDADNGNEAATMIEQDAYGLSHGTTDDFGGSNQVSSTYR